MAKRIFLPLLLILLMLFETVFSCYAAAREYYYDGAWHPYSGNEFSLKVNGELLETSMPPIIFDDYSVVPAREVFEHLGAKVDWDGAKAEVTVTYDSKEILLKINSKKAKIDGATVNMPIAPKIINEKTMIPARFVAEEIGLLVDFDSKTDTILIDTPEPAAITTVRWRTNAARTYGYLTIQTEDEDVKVSAFAMENPVRIVVDVEDTVNRTGKTVIDINEKNVQKVRMGQQIGSTRLVVDLTEASLYETEVDEGIIIVTIKLSKNAKPSASPSPTPTARPKPTIVPSNPNAGDATASPSATPPASASPSASPSPTPTPKPIVISRYVTIDAGHGGTDPGAIYENEDGEITAMEKDINLAVALKVRDLLVAENVKVHMIRSTDKYVDFQKVGNIANDKETSLFVSIHTNSALTEAPNGIETWGYLTGGASYAGMTSKKLSENVLKGLIESTGAVDRGVRDGKGLAVINSSLMPATLVELGFITNEEEREKMMSDEYRDLLAEGIANGILKSLEEMGV